MSNEAQRSARPMALARLAASRARLRRTLLPDEGQHDDGDDGDVGKVGNGGAVPGRTARRWRALWRLWMRGSPLAPVLGAVGEGVNAWWRRHPWHDTVTVAGAVGQASAAPLIRRHPLAAVALGAIAGGLLVATRPWRWRTLHVYAKRSARLSAAWAAGQLAQPAVQGLLAVMAALAASPVPPRPPEAQQPAAASAGD